MSIRRADFTALGGFDQAFTRKGAFGNEDVDLGCRLLERARRIEFNASAVSWQRYVVSPQAHLRQWHQAGQADVLFARKHPEQAEAIFTLNGCDRLIDRWLWRPLAAGGPLTAPFSAMLRQLALTLAASRSSGSVSARLFFGVRSLEYWRGIREAGGLPRARVLRVLAWHSISTQTGPPALAGYAVPPELFRRQLDLLARRGFHAVSPDEALASLSGGALPRRALLLTFDDCYEDLLESALPALEERGIRAVAFAVSGQLGGTNCWDEALGARRLRLLDADGLHELERRGIEIGAHSRTHRSLPELSDVELTEEVRGSVRDLEAAGIRRPRLFAYPYGEVDARVEWAVEAAGLEAAFGVGPGRVRRDSPRFRLKRIEIGNGDTGFRLLLKVLMAVDLKVDWRRFRPPLRRWSRRLARVVRSKRSATG